MIDNGRVDEDYRRAVPFAHGEQSTAGYIDESLHGASIVALRCGHQPWPRRSGAGTWRGTASSVTADNALMPPDMPPDTCPNAEALPAGASDSVDAYDEPFDPFESMVFAALDSLPGVFRERLGSVAVVVEDEPSPSQLDAVGAHGLLGLYTGVPRTAWAADGAPLASKITIFRGPHLRQFRDPDSLAKGVAETVRHEVAHHFGISDARLNELARERHGH
jgi:predicted Zn-dependent protease with MMP-like domain